MLTLEKSLDRAGGGDVSPRLGGGAVLEGGADVTGFVLNQQGATLEVGELRLASRALKQRIAQFELSLSCVEVSGPPPRATPAAAPPPAAALLPPPSPLAVRGRHRTAG